MKIVILWVLFGALISVLANGTRADRIETSTLPQNDVILISTIDGYLIAVDSETGQQKWRFKEDSGPIINSPRDALSGLTFIPNPRNGHLYSLEDGNLGKLPFTVSEAVKGSPGRAKNGILYSGDKKDVWLSINLQTGTKTEHLPPPAEKFLDDLMDDQCIVNAFIGRTEYHLKILDSKSADREWNVSFIDYSSHLLPHDVQYSLHHFIHDGKIMTVDGLSGRILWKKEFQSVIVNMYLLKSIGLQLLPSHAVGKHVFDAIAENPQLSTDFKNFDSELNYFEPQFRTFYTNDYVEKLTNGLYRPSLFVSETLTGLYAIPLFISTKEKEFPKVLGPKVVDRMEAHLSSIDIIEHRPLIPRSQLPINIPPAMTTWKTVGEENLLLGYHFYPRNILKDVSFTDPSVFSYLSPNPFITDQGGSQVSVRKSSLPRLSGKDPLPRIQYKPDDEEDLSLSELLLVFWKAYPLAVMTIGATLIALTFATIYMCGRQSAFGFHSSSIHHQSSRDVSQASRRSRTNSEIVTNGSRVSTVTAEGSGNPPLSPGWRQIGKIQYDLSTVLGQGCEGTAVYKGRFDGRVAAVKRVIIEAFTFDRETELLRESDSHQNIVRFFCSEQDDNFRYLALELCDCTLMDYVMKPAIQQEMADMPKIDILRQASEGLLHLHNNNIMHRDIKPHNILLSKDSKGNVKAMISDFGLCKKVRLDHTSMSKMSGIVGTEGWQAAEHYHHENRVTYAVDVFSMGCVYFFVLTNGKHPYGDKFHRQTNILSGEYDLGELAKLDTSFSIAAENLIELMIDLKASKRPRLQVALSHPMFWNNERQLQFLMDVSDRIEKEDETTEVIQRLERYGTRVSRNWHNEICSLMSGELRTYRAYRSNSVRDLLRAMRNKKHHYRECSDKLKEFLGDIPNGYLHYWTSRFPRLLMHIYNAMICCAEESSFATYYPMDSHSFCNRRLEDELTEDFIFAGPGGSIRHTTSAPLFNSTMSSPGRTIKNYADIDNWRQPDAVAASSSKPHGPQSANAAKKRKKKKKAPLTVLASMEESDQEHQQDDEREEKEMSPS